MIAALLLRVVPQLSAPESGQEGTAGGKEWPRIGPLRRRWRR